MLVTVSDKAKREGGGVGLGRYGIKYFSLLLPTPIPTLSRFAVLRFGDRLRVDPLKTYGGVG